MRTEPPPVARASARGSRARRGRALLLLASLGLAGCQTPPAGERLPSGPGPAAYEELRQGGRFRVLRAAVTGTDRGFHLFGFIPLVNPSFGEATRDLYENAGVVVEGRAVALANVVHDSYSNFFLIFSLPTAQVTADVIEFE